ncbi:Photosystem I assembly protein Ycf3 [Pseudoalteromonas holothuriae]|uniref:Photosystem I assembly protein Ycf3 n=1 Tax=Pseudoalteromonas holothuriae TaxID=2963714 RepID=A0ABM9GHE3_9GAMM|nr:tetratricopeptide repeat protein [Pseudoalteromonas sp. CIP111951]CAH9056211.1 Photosystem I assembly protein Ycf3 [Pseudoalteromonas sp. CIP111951]
MLQMDDNQSCFQILPKAHKAQVHADCQSSDRVFELNADFTRHGVWGSVCELVEQAWTHLNQQEYAALLESHNYALYMVLADHREQIGLKYACLTDTATGAEKTRNFPVDRAYRMVNSLVEVVKAWKSSIATKEQWTIVVKDFSKANYLTTRFFLELARRMTDIDVLVFSEDTRLPFDLPNLGMDLVPTQRGKSLPSQPEMLIKTLDTFDADLYEHLISTNDMMAWEGAFPCMLRHFEESGDALSVAKVAIRALCLYNHYGYYHESASFVDTVLPYLDKLVGQDQITRWSYLGNIFQGMVTTGRENEALATILTHAEPYLTKPCVKAKMHYLLSMIYLRYLKDQDLDKAQYHIMRAQQEIAEAQGSISDLEHDFLSVFIDNGLAFLSVRQGKNEEALQLCYSGFKFLTEKLGDEAHKLHRSVLLYNSAQVYTMLGKNEEALKFYKEAVEMDPYYSEYYNEIGNLLQRLGRYAQAIGMYESAIKYSAPYSEVYSNKGMCHVFLEQWQEALTSFSRSLELSPYQQDVYLVRGDVFSGQDEDGMAFEDYSRAIAMSGDSATARVNRAVIHYERENYEAALRDMDRAIELEPDNLSHYENRAEIYKVMGMISQAQEDLARVAAPEMA